MNNIKTMEKNWSYTITDKNHPKCGKTLWSGRYCAVTGIVWFYNVKDRKNYFLISKRGTGAADFQGKWCLPCGFLESNETGEEGVKREILEETGIKVSCVPMFFSVETDPKYCNNGNVTLRYICPVDSMKTPKYTNINGEENEVSDLKWISEDEIDNYDFCFHHSDILYSFLYQYLGEMKYLPKISHRLSKWQM